MPRPVLYALLGVYLVALSAIGFWPSTVDQGVRPQIYEVVRWFADNGLGFVTYQLIERTANVALFVPFGLLVGSLLPRGQRGWGIPIAIAASLAIEVGQFLFLPGRYPTLSDLFTNSLGGTLGVVIVLIVRSRVRGRGSPRPVAASVSGPHRE